jgi:hypothetical protein
VSAVDTTDPDLARILRGFAEAGQFFKNGAWFIGAVGLFAVVVGSARGLFELVAISAVFFGGLVWLMLWSLRKSVDPERSPVLRAILHEPETIVSVRHGTSSSSSGHFETQWLHLRTRAGNKRGIKVAPGEIVSLAQCLARRCPNADVDVPGFRRAV